MQGNAFLLIETDARKTIDIANLINQIDGIKSVNQVVPPFNIYDIITLVETKSLGEIGAIVLKVKAIPGVYRCVTCVISASCEVDSYEQAVNSLSGTCN